MTKNYQKSPKNKTQQKLKSTDNMKTKNIEVAWIILLNPKNQNKNYYQKLGKLTKKSRKTKTHKKLENTNNIKPKILKLPRFS